MDNARHRPGGGEKKVQNIFLRVDEDLQAQNSIDSILL